MLRADDFVLPPLPNHLFQRDNSCWIYGGVTINPMAKPARQRETLHTRAIYRFHPLLRRRRLRHLLRRRRRHAPAGHHRRRGRPRRRARRGAHRHGRAHHARWPSRSSPRRCSQSDQADRVVAVELPHSHAFMHLDTVMTMVDRDTFVLYPYFDRHLRSWTLTPGDEPGGLSVARNHRSVGHTGRGARGRPRSPC